MKNKRQLVVSFCALILAIILPLTIIACNGRTEDEDNFNTTQFFINEDLDRCKGKGLTRKQLAGRIAIFDEIEDKYGGKEIVKGFPSAPHFILESPKDYISTENTRYDIKVLDENENGFIKGIKVIPYEIDAPAESEATGITEETSTELTSGTTETEPDDAAVKEYLNYLEGWWTPSGESSINGMFGVDFRELLDKYEMAGVSLEYSVDNKTNTLKVKLKGNIEDAPVDFEMVFEKVDEDHLNYYNNTDGKQSTDTYFYERYTGSRDDLIVDVG